MAASKNAQGKARQLEAARVLENDNVSRGRTGESDADALRARVASLQKDADEARRQADELRAEAARIAAARQSQERIFGIASQRDEIESGTRLAGFNSRDEEARQKATEQEAKDRGRGIRQEGKDVMGALKPLDGVTPQMLAGLQAAIAGAAGGGENEGRQLAALLRTMTAFLQRTRQENAEVRREIAELQSQLQEQRNGR